MVRYGRSQSDLKERHGEYDHWHGYSSTPLLVGDTLYQMCLRMTDPYIIAIDKLIDDQRKTAELALINGIPEGALLLAGQSIKRVIGTPTTQVGGSR